MKAFKMHQGFAPHSEVCLMVEKGCDPGTPFHMLCLDRASPHCHFSMASAVWGVGRASASGPRQVLGSEGSPGLGPSTLGPPSSEGTSHPRIRAGFQELFREMYQLRMC